MSDAVVVAVVTGTVTVLTTAIGAVIVWLKVREDVHVSRRNAGRLRKVHVAVNGQRAALEAEIVALKEEVARLNSIIERKQQQ